MRSAIGPLLLALCPLWVVGCALPERTFSRAEDLEFRQQGLLESRGSHATKASGDTSFAAPRRIRNSRRDPVESLVVDPQRQPGTMNVSSRTDETTPTEFIPGHSSDFQKTSDVEGQTSTNSTSADTRSPNDKPVHGHTDLAARPKDFETETDRSTSAEMDRSIVRQADDRSGVPSTSPIQLQGLEVDDSDNASRPADSRRSERDASARDGSDGNSPPTKTSELPADSQIQPWEHRPTAQPAFARTLNTVTAGSARETGEKRSPRDPGVSHAVGSLPALPWQEDLERLIARVERDLTQAKPDNQGERTNEDLRKQAHLRLLYLMAQRQEEALTAIPGVEPAQQEYWQQMLWAMSNSFDTVQFPEPSERAAQTVPPLSGALRQMREQAALSIKNMTFCRKISYFGNYERFPRNEFTPGYEVLLYTEIENFVSTPTVDGEYRTSLKSLIEIADSTGKIVWTKGFPSTEDFCRNPRRDYFHNYQFYIPEDLPTGAYALKLTIVDELSRKRVSNSLKFVLK